MSRVSLEQVRPEHSSAPGYSGKRRHGQLGHPGGAREANTRRRKRWCRSSPEQATPAAASERAKPAQAGIPNSALECGPARSRDSSSHSGRSHHSHGRSGACEPEATLSPQAKPAPASWDASAGAGATPTLAANKTPSDTSKTLKTRAAHGQAALRVLEPRSPTIPPSPRRISAPSHAAARCAGWPSELVAEFLLTASPSPRTRGKSATAALAGGAERGGPACGTSGSRGGELGALQFLAGASPSTRPLTLSPVLGVRQVARLAICLAPCHRWPSNRRRLASNTLAPPTPCPVSGSASAWRCLWRRHSSCPN